MCLVRINRDGWSVLDQSVTRSHLCPLKDDETIVQLHLPKCLRPRVVLVSVGFYNDCLGGFFAVAARVDVGWYKFWGLRYFVDVGLLG